MVGGNIFNVMIIVKRINKRGHLSTVYHWVSITNPYNVNIYTHSSLYRDFFTVSLILSIIYESCNSFGEMTISVNVKIKIIYMY